MAVQREIDARVDARVDVVELDVAIDPERQHLAVTTADPDARAAAVAIYLELEHVVAQQIEVATELVEATYGVCDRAARRPSPRGRSP